MKKKFLSLALVFIMALTLLPTAAFAADAVPGSFVANSGKFEVNSAKTGGTLSWSYKPGKDTNETPTTPAFTVKKGDAEVSGTAKAGTPAADNSVPYTFSITGLAEDSTDTVTFTIADGENPANSITVTYTPKQQKTITEFTATVSSNITAKAGVTYTVNTATAGNETVANPSSVLTVSGATWTSTEASSTPVTPTFGRAPDAAGTYNVEVTATVADASKEDYKIESTTKCTIQNVTVGEESTNPPTQEKPITVSAVFVDAQNVKVTWTNPEGVPADTTYNVTVANESTTINKTVKGVTSPATVKLDSAVPSGTEVSVTVAGLSGQSVVAQGNSGHITYTAVPVIPTKPTTPTEDTKAPSTDSQGIPVSSEVSNANQANQAIDTLKSTDSDTLQERLMTNETAASSFASLESAVKDAKGITVSVEVDTASVPSVVRSHTPAVTGAAFNASGSSVKLVVDAPSKSYSASSGYQISMTLTGVSNPSKLDVPVIITLPLPSDVQAGRVVVLHYHDGSSTPTRIVPVVSGSWLRFSVTGFSDFVITDSENAGNNGVSQAFTTVQGGANRNDGSLDDATLAAISAMLSGDGVFVDVPGTHWAAKEIRWARDGGLMSGYGNGYFNPTASTTRQQLWMVLARLSGTRPADMAMARQWAINTGVSDGSNPSGVLSRQQLVTMLYRFAKSQGVNVSASAKLSGYSDSAKVASYAKEALSWAAAKGIISGSNGKLNPEGTATRAHFAVFLYRYSNG